MNNVLSLWDLYNNQNEMNAILKSHGHDINNITGLSEVAVTGSFNDLENIPILVNTIQGRSGDVTISAEDIGAIPSTASCNKLWNWVLKNEQPSYVWGGNEKSTMYIYNPSTFKVSSAVTCETANNSKLLKNRDIATEVDSVNSNISTINGQIQNINAELNDLKQSVVSGKQQIVNAINDKLGYNTGLTTNNTYQDYAGYITNSIKSYDINYDIAIRLMDFYNAPYRYTVVAQQQHVVPYSGYVLLKLSAIEDIKFISGVNVHVYTLPSPDSGRVYRVEAGTVVYNSYKTGSNVYGLYTYDHINKTLGITPK